MKITIIQLDTEWLDKAANLDKIEKYIKNQTDSDLIILPEMFNTAYIMEPKLGAETIDGPTINAIKSMVSGTDTIVCGTIPTIYENRYYNTFVFIDKQGIIGNYHKQHLFALAGENKNYTSGGNDIALQIHGVIVKPLICYDLRFPYASFNKNSIPYDILIYSANWPEGRINQWQQLLIARAIENQSYVIGVNRVGMDANGYYYPGKSMIVSYSGDILQSFSSREEARSYKLDLDALYRYRQQFPFLQDRKVF